MDTQMEKQPSNADRLRALEIGDTAKWPIEKLTTIRAALYTYGRAWRRVFTSRTDENFIYVTREK